MSNWRGEERIPTAGLPGFEWVWNWEINDYILTRKEEEPTELDLLEEWF